MKTLLLTTVLWTAFAGGDRERGVQLYKDGKYPEAQAAFTAAVVNDPESAELQWNLALAAWRAGDLATAELAAEKYSALAKDAKDELHRGMLGAIRFAEALELEQQADTAIAAAQSQPARPDPDADEPVQPLPLLEKALQKAVNARNHFVRGARANPKPEILRNTERALRKIEELKKRIEEMQQQQQQQDEGDKSAGDKQQEQDGNEGDQKSGDEKSDEKQEGEERQEEGESDEKKGDQSEGQQSDEKSSESESEKPDSKSEQTDPQQQSGEDPPQTPEPQPNPDTNQQEGEPKPGEQNPGEQQPEPDSADGSSSEEPRPQPPEPKPGESRSDAPGENGQGLELTPEQAQRLLERAKKLDAQLRQAKKRATSRRRAVERDW